MDLMTELRILEGSYLRDVLDQPRALAETIARLEPSEPLRTMAGRLARGACRRIVLTGMGSSHHGLVPLQLRLVAAGHAPLLVEASELLHHQRPLLADGTMLVVMSQSGRSAEIVRLLELVRGHGVDVLAITNTPGSPLEREAMASVLTHAGEEATVSCKTYLAAQAALAFAGEVLAGGDAGRVREQLAAAAPTVTGYLARWREHVETVAPLLRGARAIYYAGRGASLAAAATAGLITKESTHHPAEGMSSAAFRHGPLEMLDADVFLLVFEGAESTRALNRALVGDVRAAGARAYLAGADAAEPVFRLPAVSDAARPVVELLPVEMITLALAAIDGREAGRFERAGKVTTSE
jgi:glutamine---fructose-6-phosphate transaminase (isomerizing)